MAIVPMGIDANLLMVATNWGKTIKKTSFTKRNSALTSSKMDIAIMEADAISNTIIKVISLLKTNNKFGRISEIYSEKRGKVPDFWPS